LDQAELDGEPVDARQALLDGRVLAGERGLADLLVEVGEARVHDHRRVAEDVVEAVGRRRVVEFGAGADVVRAGEDTAREVGEEVVGVEQAGRACDPPAGRAVELARHVGQRGDAVAFEFQRGEAVRNSSAARPGRSVSIRA